MDTSVETSHAFTVPALLQMEGTTVARRAAAWIEHKEEAENQISKIQQEIDDLCFSLYQIDEDDRRAIGDGFTSVGAGDVDCEAGDLGEADETVEDGEPIGVERRLVTELFSWMVGEPRSGSQRRAIASSVCF